MKKSILLWVIVLLVSISLIASFTLAGCKTEEEAPAAEEAMSDVEEAEAAPAEEEATTEEAEEVVEEPSINLEDYFTSGPQGEVAVMYDMLTLSDAEKEEIKAGNYKAAYLLHTSADFTNALILGARDLFEELNIEMVITTDAGMDSAQQKNDVETAMALDPDIILTLVIDPVSGAEAFRPAVEAGVKLVFMSNLPQGYVHNQDYVSIVTDDLYGMGKAAAEMLADSMGEEGKVGWIYHDAEYYVTNQRDNAFKAVIQANYPNIEIIAEQGLANPADSEAIASAMITQNPDIGGFYVPWDTPAEGVVAACRAANRPDIKVVTLDLGANNGLDMVQGGNIVGIAADLAYMLGYTKAMAGVYGILGKEAPSFIIVPAIKVTKDNIVEGWNESLNVDPPEEILNALN